MPCHAVILCFSICSKSIEHVDRFNALYIRYKQLTLVLSLQDPEVFFLHFLRFVGSTRFDPVLPQMRHKNIYIYILYIIFSGSMPWHGFSTASQRGQDQEDPRPDTTDADRVQYVCRIGACYAIGCLGRWCPVGCGKCMNERVTNVKCRLYMVEFLPFSLHSDIAGF